MVVLLRMAKHLRGVLQVQGDPSEAAVYFLKVTQILLHQVQQSILWGAPGMPMDEDEEDDVAGPMSASSGARQPQAPRTHASRGAPREAGLHTSGQLKACLIYSACCSMIRQGSGNCRRAVWA